jgi:hypothetical protein
LWNNLSHAGDINVLRSHCKSGEFDITGGVRGGYLHLSGLIVFCYCYYRTQCLGGSPYTISRDSIHLHTMDHAASFTPDTRVDIEGPDKINDGTILYSLALGGMPTMERHSTFMILKSTIF